MKQLKWWLKSHNTNIHITSVLLQFHTVQICNFVKHSVIPVKLTSYD